jgi:hypothetical protein
MWAGPYPLSWFFFWVGLYNDRPDHKCITTAQIRIVIRYLEVRYMVYYHFKQ